MPVRKAALAAERVTEEEHEEAEVDAYERGQHPQGGAPAERLSERAAEEGTE